MLDFGIYLLYYYYFSWEPILGERVKMSGEVNILLEHNKSRKNGIWFFSSLDTYPFYYLYERVFTIAEQRRHVNIGCSVLFYYGQNNCVNIYVMVYSMKLTIVVVDAESFFDGGREYQHYSVLNVNTSHPLQKQYITVLLKRSRVYAV